MRELVGTYVEIRSRGVVYRGVVKSIEDAGELAEIFELGSDEAPEYRRFLLVVDRRAQVREIRQEP